MYPSFDLVLCFCRNCLGDHHNNSFVILLNAVDCDCMKCKLLVAIRNKARDKKLESFIHEVVDNRYERNK